MPEQFPPIGLDKKMDANPAVRLFGRRFFADQTTLELLVEMLLVATSPKRVGGATFDALLPTPDLLRSPWTKPLEYAPRARLNLKLFAFFSASKLDTRHAVHRQHLEELQQRLEERLRVSDDTRGNVLKTLANLFLGFQGIGMERTWCAQSFMPVCSNMVAGESIWKQSKGKNIANWTDSLSFFSHRQALFLARGGEVLYLQLCNALRRAPAEVEAWLSARGLAAYLTSEEKNPAWLRTELELGLGNLMRETPATVSRLADFIDRGVEEETARRTDAGEAGRNWTRCGWCPEESWPEGYLFAVELSRICRANLYLLDRLEILESACAMQVMRSLIAQAARYSGQPVDSAWPAWRLAVSDPEGTIPTVKHVSRATVQAASKTLYDALRHPDIVGGTPASGKDTLYKQADAKYGHKLFIALAKRIGLIVPRKGPGMRFVVNGRLLRMLVVALLPGRRMTYDTFKLAAEAHFGLAFDEAALVRANRWATGADIESFGCATDDWLGRMLEEAGCLRRLSDSCALVENCAAPQDLEE